MKQEQRTYQCQAAGRPVKLTWQTFYVSGIDVPTMQRDHDTLVVWRLDRLGRSLHDLVRIVAELEQRGVHFESLTEKIETGSASGKLQFHVFVTPRQ